MKNRILMLLLVGLFSSYASASVDSNSLKKLNKESEAPTKEAVADGESNGVKTPKPIIDETALYYLFSTIAQTLAGAFGILGAFTMYRLQSIKNACSGIGDTIIQSAKIGQLPEVHMSYSNKDWNLFRKSIEEYMAQDDGGRPRFLSSYSLSENTVNMYCKSLTDLMSSHTKIRKQILRSLKLTVITISYSLFMLPFSIAVAHYPVAGMLLTAIAILLSFKCLIDYSILGGFNSQVQLSRILFCHPVNFIRS